MHSCIAEDLFNKLKKENFRVCSLGFQAGQEKFMKGRYLDKKVDISIKNTQSDRDICGIGVKFVMSNYSQNSNNYFENMLGETANIRCNDLLYF